MNGNQAISICGEELILNAKRAIYWHKEKALIIADLHIGKSAHFRKNGIAVTAKVQQADLEQLTKLIEEFLPEKIIVVGDMFHKNYNADIALFEKWRTAFEGIKIMLVPGNHDHLFENEYRTLNISVEPEILKIGPFVFTHHYQCPAEGFCISGHIHPGVSLAGKAKQHIKLPCFVVAKDHLVLPAFSVFTGLDMHSVSGADIIYYAIGEEHIFKL